MKRALILVGLLLLALGGGLGWLLASESGLNWAYRHAAVQLPGLLTIERLRGRLAGAMLLEGFDYRDGPLRFAARRVELHWNPAALLAGEFDIGLLEVNTLQVELPAADSDAETPASLELPALVTPLPIHLGHLEIDGLRLLRGDRRDLLERVSLGGYWRRAGVEIEQASIEATDYRIGIGGTLNPDGAWPHRLRLDWRWRLPSGAELAGHGSLDGDLYASSLQMSLGGAVSLEARLELTDPLGDPGWQLEARLTDFDSARLDAGLPPVTGAISVIAGGDLQSLNARGELRVDSPPTGPLQTAFAVDRLALDSNGSAVLFDSLALDNAYGSLLGSGRLDWADNLAWAVTVIARDIDPAQFAPDWPGRLDADFDVSGKLGDETPALDVVIRRLDGRLRDYPVSLAGRGHWSGDDIEMAGVRFVSAESTLRLDGRVGEQLALVWALDSPNLGQFWPGAGGRLSAAGRLDGERRTPRLSATLDGENLALAETRIARLQGRVDIDLQDGEPWLSPGGRFELSARADELRIGELDITRLQLDGDRQQIRASADSGFGRLALTLAGTLENEAWRGRVLAAELALDGYGDWRLDAPAALSVAMRQIKLERACLVQQQAARLCASVVGIDDDWRIDSEAEGVQVAWLGRWLPVDLAATGELTASSRLRYQAAQRLLGEVQLRLGPGTADLPLDRDRIQRLDFAGGRLELRLEVTGIKGSATLGLRPGESCSASVDLPGANALTLDRQHQPILAEARCRLSNLDIAEVLLDDIDDLSGSAELDLRLRGSPAQPNIDGSARIADARFSLPALGIRVDNFTAEAFSKGPDRVDFSAEATLAGGRIALDGHTELDAEAGWPTQFGLRGRELALAALLAGRLPEGMRVEGQVIVDGDLQLRLPDRLDGSLRVAAESGAFAYPLVEGEETRWRVDEAVFEARFGQDGIGASAAIEIDDNRLEGRWQLPGARLGSFEPAQQALTGNLDLRVPDLSPLGAWLTEIRQPSGRLQAQLEVAGTAASPRFRIGADLDEGALQVPRLGLVLGPISARVRSHDDGELRLDAEVGAEQGSLEISGRAQLDAARLWPINIRIVGQDFPVARLDVARVDVSPQLDIEIGDHQVEVSGEVRVPFARLRPRDITTADRVSADAVTIGAEAPTRSWRVTSRIRLILGDRVDFFGYGFDGKLGGNLLIEELPGQPTRGSGEINVISGRYLAYGQALEIENGRLIFAGGPLGNPGLDVVAVRRAGEVTAGLRVGGRLQQPELELFSLPAMGQTDALSYLLTGGPLETATSQQGAMMANAALAIGLSGGDRIARSLGNRFGFDELRVESSSTGEQASLVVGRYLSPRLYVSYGVGLIESINTLNLRYTISPRWRIEAESGAEHGADLLYSIER